MLLWPGPVALCRHSNLDEAATFGYPRVRSF
jgi:hypothetical protein